MPFQSTTKLLAFIALKAREVRTDFYIFTPLVCHSERMKDILDRLIGIRRHDTRHGSEVAAFTYNLTLTAFIVTGSSPGALVFSTGPSDMPDGCLPRTV